MRQSRFKQSQRSDPAARRIVARQEKEARARRRDIPRAGMDGDDYAVVAGERPSVRRTTWYLLG
jgi:hypothetical protein